MSCWCVTTKVNRQQRLGGWQATILVVLAYHRGREEEEDEEEDDELKETWSMRRGVALSIDIIHDDDLLFRCTSTARISRGFLKSNICGRLWHRMDGQHRWLSMRHEIALQISLFNETPVLSIAPCRDIVTFCRSCCHHHHHYHQNNNTSSSRAVSTPRNE